MRLANADQCRFAKFWRYCLLQSTRDVHWRGGGKGIATRWALTALQPEPIEQTRALKHRTNMSMFNSNDKPTRIYLTCPDLTHCRRPSTQKSIQRTTSWPARQRLTSPRLQVDHASPNGDKRITLLLTRLGTRMIAGSSCLIIRSLTVGLCVSASGHKS